MPNKPMKKKEECKKHDKESECGDCGKKFYLIPKKDKPSNLTTKKMEEFDEKYVDHCSDGDILNGMVSANTVKKWLKQSLQQARQHERELIKKCIEGIKKENLSNKTWDEYAEGYNDARKDIKNIIEKL